MNMDTICPYILHINFPRFQLCYGLGQQCGCGLLGGHEVDGQPVAVHELDQASHKADSCVLISDFWDFFAKFNDIGFTPVLVPWHWCPLSQPFHDYDRDSRQIIAHSATNTSVTTFPVVHAFSLLAFCGLLQCWLRIVSWHTSLIRDRCWQMLPSFDRQRCDHDNFLTVMALRWNIFDVAA